MVIEESHAEMMMMVMMMNPVIESARDNIAGMTKRGIGEDQERNVDVRNPPRMMTTSRKKVEDADEEKNQVVGAENHRKVVEDTNEKREENDPILPPRIHPHRHLPLPMTVPATRVAEEKERRSSTKGYLLN